MENNAALIKTIRRKLKRTLENKMVGKLEVENGITLATIRIEEFENTMDYELNELMGIHPFVAEVLQLTRDKVSGRISQNMLEAKIKDLQKEYNITPRKS